MIKKNSLKTSVWKKRMRTNFSIPDPGRCVGDGQGVAWEKNELPLFQRDCEEGNVLMGKPDQENEILDN